MQLEAQDTHCLAWSGLRAAQKSLWGETYCYTFLWSSVFERLAGTSPRVQEDWVFDILNINQAEQDFEAQHLAGVEHAREEYDEGEQY